MLLTRAQADAWLGADTGHVPVPLRRVPDAQLLWLNERAAADDPHFARLGRELQRYGEHLLAHGAWQVAAPGQSADTIGHADRYGGSGIGHNGGSGRAVTWQGYHLKGVGRTPLVSALTPPTHAAGGAYLEEAVREAIFAELAAQSLPHGAVPTLAIIDLGLVQDWQTPWSPRRERRVVMVRPAFLRPAHVERAVGFVAADDHAARQDADQVAAMFRALQAATAPGELPALFERLWRRWAAQLAHGFIHQFSHGNDTSSNIALDGRLVDFGAATFVPSWARVASTRHPVGLGERLDALTGAQRSLAWHLGRYLTPERAGAPHLQAQRQGLQRQVQQRLCDAPRQRLGLTTLAGATYAPGTPAVRRLAAALHRTLLHFDAECLDMLEATPEPRRPMDWHAFWHVDGPPHWRPLREALSATPGLTEATRLSSPVDVDAQRALCFPELKRRLFAEVDASERNGPPPTRAVVGEVIARHVALGLRALGRHPAAPHRAVPAAARSRAH